MADSEMLREILKCKSCSPFSTFGFRFSIPLLNSILTMTPVFFMKYKYETHQIIVYGEFSMANLYLKATSSASRVSIFHLLN